ncbi:MAG: hypothetical protein NVS4B8_27230 [Herpetosiphon sp.]
MIAPQIPDRRAPPGNPMTRSFFRQHWQKLVALVFWFGMLAGYQRYAWSHQISPLEALARITDLLRSTAFGPLLFIGLYALRPLVLFPASVLTLGAGLVFGPVLGVMYTIVGSNLSALLAFGVGHWFGEGLLGGERAAGVVQRYAARLRQHSFETVLLMRLIFLPYDLVNYLCGVLHIDWKAFLLATLLGSLPGTFAIVLAGASFKGDLRHGLPSFDPRVFAASVVIIVVSMAISRWVRRREKPMVTR